MYRSVFVPYCTAEIHQKEVNRKTDLFQRFVISFDIVYFTRRCWPCVATALEKKDHRLNARCPSTVVAVQSIGGC
jgi:hypothetical protein